MIEGNKEIKIHSFVVNYRHWLKAFTFTLLVFTIRQIGMCTLKYYMHLLLRFF